MPIGPVAFLVDTNVLVYAYDPSDAPKRARATEVLEELAARGTGCLSVQILGEFFVTVTRKIPARLTAVRAERSVTNYARSWPVLDLTTPILLEATRGSRRHQLAYWDALIWATAKAHGVPNVLSEDFRHGALVEGVRFVSPFASGFDVASLGPP